MRWVADRDWTLSRTSRSDVAGPWALVARQPRHRGRIRLNGLPVHHPPQFPRARCPVADALVPGENRIEILLRPAPAPPTRSRPPSPSRSPTRRQLPDPQWQHASQAAVRLRLGLEHRAGAARRPRPHGLVGPEGEIGDVASVSTTRPAASPRRSISMPAATAIDTVGEVAVCGGRDPARPAPPRGYSGPTSRSSTPGALVARGAGAQPIHDLEIRAGDLVRVMPVALRDIRLVSEPDATGRSFALHVNGRPIFARGANWIPADALPGRITDAKTRGLLQSAADANMNMIRVWGGGRYEPASFYEACDALGLLVWQDFMFACHLYPHRRLPQRGRPGGLRPGPPPRPPRRPLVRRQRAPRRADLVRGIAQQPRPLPRRLRPPEPHHRDRAKRPPAANWWPSSPSPGPMSFGDTWHDDTSGDMHFWSVWHEGRDFEHYRDVRPRFCSEFGFQSYTSLPVIRSFAEEADLNIASPVMESHQKNAGGNARIAETMSATSASPRTSPPSSGSPRSSRARHQDRRRLWRSLKPHCMGALYWQLNDTWPVASWSSLDYGGGWKRCTTWRGAFPPVTVVAIPDRRRPSASSPSTTPPTRSRSTAELFAVPSPARPGRSPPPAPRRHRGRRAARRNRRTRRSRPARSSPSAGGRRRHDRRRRPRPGPLGRHSTSAPRISRSPPPRRRGLVARVTAEAVALFVTLEADRPGRFSDNAVELFPGHDAEIRFTPAAAIPPASPSPSATSIRASHA